MQRDLNWNTGRVNPSGIRSIAYWIDKADIEPSGFPLLPETPANVAETVTLEGDFVLKPGAFFKKIYTTQGKGKVEFEAIGEKDVQMFMNKGTLRYPDITAEAKSMAKSTMNSNTIFVIPIRTSGANRPQIQFAVLGGKDYDTNVKITGTSGDNPGSDKGITVEIESPDFCPIPTYVGELVLEDGVLDCETDTFTPGNGGE
jgi:hypothetical protein